MSGWNKVSAENGEVWDRQKSIEGKYIKAESNVGPNKSNLYTLKTKDGPVGVWGSTVLDSKFEEIEVGSLVKIEPLGLKEGKTGKQYQDYDVFWKEDDEVDISEAPDFLK